MLTSKIKTCSIPTVCLLSGFVVGSNLGLAICSNQRSCYTESYLGVVDLGLGLIPVGGVTKDIKKIEETIKLTQMLTSKIKTCSIPNVCLLSGFVVGSNLGLAICSNQRSCYTESYLGVVDLGLGLIPVGGVTNELLKKLDQEIAPGDPENNRLSFLHENFTFKKVSSSALTAKRNGLLDLRENLIFNPKKTILDAKNKITQLNKKGFVSDSINTKITARGSQSLAVLYTQTENLKESGLLTDSLSETCLSYSVKRPDSLRFSVWV
jgi:3-hydroxyacyl-CoA dehydrogenase